MSSFSYSLIHGHKTDVRRRSIFCDFVSRCSVFLMVYFGVHLLVLRLLLFAFLPFFVDIFWVNLNVL